MGLGQRKSGGSFLPTMKYDARCGVIYTQDRVHRNGEWQTEQHDITEGFEAIFDLVNAEVGWINFPKGAPPEMTLRPVGEDIGARPSPDHKEGLRLIVKIPGDDAGPREFISTAYAVWRGIDLHDQYLAAAESTKGLLPVVVLSDVKVVESVNGTSHEPIFSIVDWVPRPSDLPEKGIAPAEPKPKKPKPADKRGDMDDVIPF
jgi:hypothetical protein